MTDPRRYEPELDAPVRSRRRRTLIGAAAGTAVVLVATLVLAVTGPSHSHRSTVRTGAAATSTTTRDLTNVPSITDPTADVTASTTPVPAHAPAPAPTMRRSATTAAPTTTAAPRSTTADTPGTWVVAPDGSGLRRVADGFPSGGVDVSADATRVAYLINGDLWTVGADGVGARKVVAQRPGSLVACCLVSWAPSGTTLAFGASDGGPNQVVDLVAADGSGLRTLGPEGSGTPLVWSHDGTRLAYVDSGFHIQVVDAATGAATTLPPQAAAAPFLTWSPDDHRLAYEGGDNGPHIEVVNADGTGVQAVPGPNQPLMALEWADADHLLYSQGYGTPVDVWSVTADGADNHKLISGAYGPRWSPAALTIAYLGVDGFIKGMGDYKRDLHVAGADGSNPHRIVAAGPNIQTSVARWAANGKLLVFGTFTEKP